VGWVHARLQGDAHPGCWAARAQPSGLAPPNSGAEPPYNQSPAFTTPTHRAAELRFPEALFEKAAAGAAAAGPGAAGVGQPGGGAAVQAAAPPPPLQQEQQQQQRWRQRSPAPQQQPQQQPQQVEQPLMQPGMPLPQHHLLTAAAAGVGTGTPPVACLLAAGLHGQGQLHSSGSLGALLADQEQLQQLQQLQMQQQQAAALRQQQQQQLLLLPHAWWLTPQPGNALAGGGAAAAFLGQSQAAAPPLLVQGALHHHLPALQPPQPLLGQPSFPGLAGGLGVAASAPFAAAALQLQTPPGGPLLPGLSEPMLAARTGSSGAALPLLDAYFQAASGGGSGGGGGGGSPGGHGGL
jgi:hypothetical protein